MPTEKLIPKFIFDEVKIKQLKQIAPEVFADGKINWDTLKENLGDHLEDDGQEAEHFGLFWPGKRDARKLAALPSKGTLIPVTGEGIDEETTRNIFIEGENLEVLKLLQKSYVGRIKMIDIDPPYNTGNDFVYEDDFKEPLEEYLKRTGQLDEEGKPLTTNTRADGRFHSKWLSMMYPRLRLARNLLRDDGVIFVHIDDNEVHNLRAIMNEIFGEENILAQFVWRTDGNFDNQAKVKNCHEYVLAYCKDINSFPPPPVIDPSISEKSKLHNEEIKNTIVKNGPANPISEIVLPKGFPASFEKGLIEKIKNGWPRYLNDARVENYKLMNETIVESGWSSKDLALEFINSKMKPILDGKGQETSFILSSTGAIEIVKKRKENQSHVISVLTNLGNTQSTSATLRKENIYFDYPKPIPLVKYLISMNEGDDFISLDFFAGSSTIATAVLELNLADKKRRTYISVQLPELIKKDSASKNDFQNLADLSLERIKKTANKIKKENPKIEIDLGVKVFKLMKSNYKPWKNFEGQSVEELEKQFALFSTPLVDGWKPEDLLIEVLLLEGFPLDSKIKLQKDFKNNKVHEVSSDFFEHKLLVCLDKKLTLETVANLKIADEDIFVCLDSAISDQDKVRLGDKGLIKTI